MKAWDGRFFEKTHPFVEKFTSSISVDKKLYKYDILGSIAQAEMLKKIGVISFEEKEKIVNALKEIKEEIEKGEFTFSDELEDIHMHVEAKLIEKIGDLGKKLHAGRSRNDQVSLDIRMFIKEELKSLELELLELMRTLLLRAEKEKNVIMPGYTHMQKAQVVLFSHYLLSFYYMLKRDRERLRSAILSADSMPLGSGALAGSTIPVDREYLKERLNFSKVTENSIDTVSDRDFLIDALYATSMIMIHLSRMCEDFIIFSTYEFSFLRLPDSLSTGSSIMPHKRNPDIFELIRGKASRVIGDLVSLLIMMKGLPSTYNRDLQEDKEPLFHAVFETKESLKMLTICVREMEIRKEKMEEATYTGYIEATELAEYLVMKGLPFREAHKTVGRMVRECEKKGIMFKDLKIEELKRFSELFDEDVYQYMDPHTIVKLRKTKGGASLEEVVNQIEKEKLYLDS